MNILYYVSGHGYGHISRSYEIIKAILEDNENNRITVVSGRNDFITSSHNRLQKRKILMDVGIYQKDSLSLDLEKTKHALEEFESHKNDLLRNEVEFARKEDFDLILSDSASLPFVLGVELGIPALFVGNFTWDFIYANYKSIDPYFGVMEHIMEVEYSFATTAIQLPLTCPMKGFLETYKVGFVGRKPKMNRNEARKFFGMDDDSLHFLFSFGAYGLAGSRWNWENKPSHWKIYQSGTDGIQGDVVTPLSVSHYPDLVHAVDYVVTKPGYGIISECVFCETPILYTDRGNFAEYPVLVDWLEKNHPSAFIPQDELLDLRWESSLSQIKGSEESKFTKSSFKNGEKEIVEILKNFHG